jgi:hypothetical protein
MLFHLRMRRCQLTDTRLRLLGLSFASAVIYCTRTYAPSESEGDRLIGHSRTVGATNILHAWSTYTIRVLISSFVFHMLAARIFHVWSIPCMSSSFVLHMLRHLPSVSDTSLSFFYEIQILERKSKYAKRKIRYDASSSALFQVSILW